MKYLAKYNPSSKLEIILATTRHYLYALRYMLGENHWYSKWCKMNVDFSTYLFGLFKDRIFTYDTVAHDDIYKKEK